MPMKDNEHRQFCWKRIKNYANSQTNSHSVPILQQQTILKNIGAHKLPTEIDFVTGLQKLETDEKKMWETRL